MRTLLLIGSALLFLLAGVSAAAESVNLNELAFACFGAAAYVASHFVPDRLP